MGTHVSFAARPHSSSPAMLAQQASIYRQGRTPVVGPSGRIEALDIAPAGTRTAGRHLDEIASNFGESGLARSIHGLGVTRGWDFAKVAVRHASPRIQTSRAGTLHGGALVGDAPAGDIVGARIGPAVASTIQRSIAAERVSAPEGAGDVRIHRDGAAHEAARMLNARAFAIGPSIYFGEHEYRPSTLDGRRLLAHEMAHTVQQSETSGGRLEDATIASPSSAAEYEADRFAQATIDGGTPAPIRQRTSGAARVMRVISFTRANDAFTINHPGTQETAVDFQIAAGAPAAPHFQWDTDVTIHGNAGDPFGDFEIGPHQVVRAFWLNIWWGTGANRVHRTSHVATPIRDTATTAADIWYATPLVSAPFGAAGDVRHGMIQDTPGVRGQPFANPNGNPGTRGWFNWGMAFVAFVSARDTTAGGGAGAFRHIAHVYWNLSLDGNFDTTRPVNARVHVTGGGQTNRGGVIAGPSGAFPAMHGGAQFNDQANANLTTTP